MRRLLLAGVTALGAGCAVGPNYERPEVPVPVSWRDTTLALRDSSYANLPWWQVYSDTTLQGLIRTTDFAARYGGDEFVVLLVRTDREGARLVAEKMRARVEGLGMLLGYPTRTVTASIGVAAFVPMVDQHDDVLVAADRALYRAKSRGRNRVDSGEPR